MRFLIPLAVALGVLAAGPASAQYFDRGENSRYEREIDWRLHMIYDRIERGRHTRQVSEGEARRLHSVGRSIFERFRYFARDGLDRWEYDDLSRRLWDLRQRIQWEFREPDYRDDWRDREWRGGRGWGDDRDWNDDSRWRGDWDDRDGRWDRRDDDDDERWDRRNGDDSWEGRADDARDDEDRWLEREDRPRWSGPEGDGRRDDDSQPRGDFDPDDIFDDEDWDEQRQEDDDWYRVPDTP